jgi:hypothetical protein
LFLHSFLSLLIFFLSFLLCKQSSLALFHVLPNSRMCCGELFYHICQSWNNIFETPINDTNK